MLTTPLRARRSPVLAVAWDVVVAAALALYTVIELAVRELQPGQRPTTAVAYLLAIAMAAPYAFHRRRPALALAVMISALAIYSLLSLSAFPGFNAFVLLFGVTLHGDRRRSLVALAAIGLALSFALSTQPAGVATGSTWVSTALATAVSWLLADNIRSRRARWAALESRTRDLEGEREERARQAVVEERLRIARELHDVVAHSMSVIAVQSSVGLVVIDSDVDEARRALAAISTTSRSVLTEMRRLLGVLRQDDEPQGALSPAPGLVDLTWLVEQVTDAGVAVTVDVAGAPDNVPAGLELSVFRIVQEALTNVLKHGGRTADVRIGFTDHDIGIEVVDHGFDDDTVFNRGHHAVTPGHGIIGMRERVAVFGGQFTAGPRPGGGFRVAARLPFEVSVR